MGSRTVCVRSYFRWPSLGQRSGLPRKLCAPAQPSTNLPRVAAAVHACQYNDEAFKRSIPEHVWEPSKKDPAGSAIALGVREWAICDTRDRFVYHLQKLTAEPLTLTVIPVLDRRQVELCGSAKENRERQRGRCWRRALTSD